MLGGQAMVVEYPIYKNLPFGCLAKHVALHDASATGVHLIIYHQEAQQVTNFQIKFLIHYKLKLKL
jgi:hypothetical protein